MRLRQIAQDFGQQVRRQGIDRFVRFARAAYNNPHIAGPVVVAGGAGFDFGRAGRIIQEEADEARGVYHAPDERLDEAEAASVDSKDAGPSPVPSGDLDIVLSCYVRMFYSGGGGSSNVNFLLNYNIASVCSAFLANCPPFSRLLALYERVGLDCATVELRTPPFFPYSTVSSGGVYSAEQVPVLNAMGFDPLGLFSPGGINPIQSIVNNCRSSAVAYGNLPIVGHLDGQRDSDLLEIPFFQNTSGPFYSVSSPKSPPNLVIGSKTVGSSLGAYTASSDDAYLFITARFIFKSPKVT